MYRRSEAISAGRRESSNILKKDIHLWQKEIIKSPKDCESRDGKTQRKNSFSWSLGVKNSKEAVIFCSESTLGDLRGTNNDNLLHVPLFFNICLHMALPIAEGWPRFLRLQSCNFLSRREPRIIPSKSSLSLLEETNSAALRGKNNDPALGFSVKWIEYAIRACKRQRSRPKRNERCHMEQHAIP